MYAKYIMLLFLKELSLSKFKASQYRGVDCIISAYGKTFRPGKWVWSEDGRHEDISKGNNLVKASTEQGYIVSSAREFMRRNLRSAKSSCWVLQYIGIETRDKRVDELEILEKKITSV